METESADRTDRALLLALATYGAVFALKLGAYALTGALVVLAEALHTLSDVVIAAFLLAASRWSWRATDDVHMFGYGRTRLPPARGGGPKAPLADRGAIQESRGRHGHTGRIDDPGRVAPAEDATERRSCCQCPMAWAGQRRAGHGRVVAGAAGDSARVQAGFRVGVDAAATVREADAILRLVDARVRDEANCQYCVVQLEPDDAVAPVRPADAGTPLAQALTPASAA